MLINPPKLRKGVLGWKLSKNKPSKSKPSGNEKLFGRRSKSTKPEMINKSRRNCAEEMSYLHNSGSNGSINAYIGKTVDKQNTIDSRKTNESLLKNDRLHFLPNSKIGVPVPNKDIGIFNENLL